MLSLNIEGKEIGIHNQIAITNCNKTHQTYWRNKYYSLHTYYTEVITGYTHCVKSLFCTKHRLQEKDWSNFMVCSETVNIHLAPDLHDHITDMSISSTKHKQVYGMCMYVSCIIHTKIHLFDIFRLFLFGRWNKQWRSQSYARNLSVWTASVEEGNLIRHIKKASWHKCRYIHLNIVIQGLCGYGYMHSGCKSQTRQRSS